MTLVIFLKLILTALLLGLMSAVIREKVATGSTVERYLGILSVILFVLVGVLIIGAIWSIQIQ